MSPKELPMKSLIALLSLLATSALAMEPVSVEDVLKRYDAIMGPQVFQTESEMTSVRDDGTSRTYVMRMLKRDNDKFRVWFNEPGSVKGQEMLRNGDNVWVYLPNLKRATRIANRDNFQGGDFNNADVLRVNYAADYDGAFEESKDPTLLCLRLKAKTKETSYDSIRLFVRKSDLQPVKGEYFGTSGQMIRSAEFLDIKELDKGYSRPTRVVMHNEVVKTRKSEMIIRKLQLAVDAPAQRFTQADLGH
jgi:outer membrane lipoprotein-sorting protein